MNGFFRGILIFGVLCCMVLLAAAAAHGAGDLVTEPEKCLFLGPPYRLAYLQEENMLLMVNGGGIYAFDLASGGQVWHRYLVSSNGGRGASFGKRQVLGWSDDGVFLLDAVTGRETWWRRDNQCGAMEHAVLSPDETQMLVSCERGLINYTVAGHRQRTLPRLPNAWLCGWLPGEGKLLLQQDEKADNAEKAVRKWLFMDTDSGAVTPGWERPFSPDDPFLACSSQGELAEAIKAGEDTSGLKISDGRTGTILHEFKGIPGKIRYFFWLRDGKRLFFLAEDRKRVCMVDAETGAVQFSLSRDGHRFTMNTFFEDASDRGWIFSQDEANHRYVWPLVAGGAPKKVLDGSRIGPGYFQVKVSDPCYILATGMVEDQTRTCTAYTLGDMVKTAAWRVPVSEFGWSDQMLNKSLTHCVDIHPVAGEDQYRPQNMAFSVSLRDTDKPLRTGTGRPLAVSPDAKYLVVQIDDVTACLYDTESGRMAGRYAAAPVGEKNSLYMRAAFSDDGKGMVLSTTQSLEVTDLTEGCPRRSMAIGGDKQILWSQPCLSPDRTRVLVGGNGHACLFDAGTGVLLHTFTETEHFAETWGRGEGFWSSLETTAKDWVGMVTDRFKPGANVEAVFADSGARIITHAAGQVIRVWDTASGRLLHTIHTELPEKRNKYGHIRNEVVFSATARFAFCFNINNFAPASLWSLEDGALLRRYQLPDSTWTQAAPTDDGTAVYIQSNDNLYRWPGAPKKDE